MHRHAIFVLTFVGNNTHICMWEKIACCVDYIGKDVSIIFEKKICKNVFACSIVLSILLGNYFRNFMHCMHRNNIHHVSFSTKINS